MEPDHDYSKPDPDCRACRGGGSYYEDVAGDGGSRMQVHCECWEGEDYVAEDAHDDHPNGCRYLGNDMWDCGVLDGGHHGTLDG